MDTSQTQVLDNSMWSQPPDPADFSRLKKGPRRKKPPIETRLGPIVMEERILSQRPKKVPSINYMPLVEHQIEYPIEKMEQRAERLSDMPTLRKRKNRFDEETASEFTSVTEAKIKNLRLKRFKLEEDDVVENL